MAVTECNIHPPKSQTDPKSQTETTRVVNEELILDRYQKIKENKMGFFRTIGNALKTLFYLSPIGRYINPEEHDKYSIIYEVIKKNNSDHINEGNA